VAETAGINLCLSAPVSHDVGHRGMISGKPIRGAKPITNLCCREGTIAAGKFVLSRIRRGRSASASTAGSGRGSGSRRIGAWRGRWCREAVCPGRRGGGLLREYNSNRNHECKDKRQNDEPPHKTLLPDLDVVITSEPYTPLGGRCAIC